MTAQLFLLITNLIIILLIPVLLIMQMRVRHMLRENRLLLAQMQQQNAELLRLRGEALRAGLGRSQQP